MNSRLAERTGVQVPQIVHRPPDVRSLAAAQEAIELADHYGVCDGNPLSESQRFRLSNALGERADGSWSATVVGDFGPRQGSGKSDIINARELAGLVLFGEQLIIHTAHEFPTANESFLRLWAVFDAWDDLRKLVARPLFGNGSQAIEMRNGARLLYKARTGGGVRGFAKADLTVYDEAQNIKAEHVAASGPAKLANPNAQSWYAGSGGFASSVQAHRLRKMALMGASGRFAYAEHTAEKVSLTPDGAVRSVRPDDVLDRAVWAEAMPGYGIWVSDESIETLHLELGGDDALFAREALCVWDRCDGEKGFLPYGKWLAASDSESTVDSGLCYGLSVAPDGSWAAVASAGRRRDGKLHVDTVRYEHGTGWVVHYLTELHSRKRVPVRVNPEASEGAFLKPLRAEKVSVVEVGHRDYKQACGAFLAAVENDGLRHLDQESMNRSVAAADRRDVGHEGGWVWERPSVDISPLLAATLALSGVADAGDYDLMTSVW
jgi:hypothetical protein